MSKDEGNGIFDQHSYNNGGGWDRPESTWKRIDELQVAEIDSLKKELKFEREKSIHLGEIIFTRDVQLKQERERREEAEKVLRIIDENYMQHIMCRCDNDYKCLCCKVKEYFAKSEVDCER